MGQMADQEDKFYTIDNFKTILKRSTISWKAIHFQTGISKKVSDILASPGNGK